MFIHFICVPTSVWDIPQTRTFFDTLIKFLTIFLSKLQQQQKQKQQQLQQKKKKTQTENYFWPLDIIKAKHVGLSSYVGNASSCYTAVNNKYKVYPLHF